MTTKRFIGIAVSAYELLALATGRTPPITDIARQHPTLAAGFVGFIAWHFSPTDAT